MSKPKPHPVDQLAERMRSEVDEAAEKLHRRLVDELFDDAEEMSEPRFLAHVREQSSANPAYLQQLYEQVGAVTFNRIWEKAFEEPLRRAAVDAMPVAEDLASDA